MSCLAPTDVSSQEANGLCTALLMYLQHLARSLLTSLSPSGCDVKQGSKTKRRGAAKFSSG